MGLWGLGSVLWALKDIHGLSALEDSEEFPVFF